MGREESYLRQYLRYHKESYSDKMDFKMGPEEGGAQLEISQKQAQQVGNKKYEGLEAVWVFQEQKICYYS